jgi:hypothetical protein
VGRSGTYGRQPCVQGLPLMRFVRFGLQCDKLGPIEQPASFAAASTKAEINPILGGAACIELVTFGRDQPNICPVDGTTRRSPLAKPKRA